MENKEIMNLEVMNQMVKDNNPGIMLSNTIVDNYSVKQGGVLCFGVTREINDDAEFQRNLGIPGKYMLMCFAVDRSDFEHTKIEIKNSQQKRFFVREEYNTLHKNKLDTLLRDAFSVFENKIITESQLDQFAELHKKVSDDYFTSGGKCKPIKFSGSRSGHFRQTSSRKNDTVFVTDGYWLEIIEVIE